MFFQNYWYILNCCTILNQAWCDHSSPWAVVLRKVLWLLSSRSRSQWGFKSSRAYRLFHIFWTVEPFATEHECEKFGLLSSRWRSKWGFRSSRAYRLFHIFWTIEPFATKHGVVVHHHEPESHGCEKFGLLSKFSSRPSHSEGSDSVWFKSIQFKNCHVHKIMKHYIKWKIFFGHQWRLFSDLFFQRGGSHSVCITCVSPGLAVLSWGRLLCRHDCCLWGAQCGSYCPCSKVRRNVAKQAVNNHLIIAWREPNLENFGTSS